MTENRIITDYLEDILDAINKISFFIKGMMAGMRDKLIHDYIGVNLEVVWKTVREDLPGLEKQIRNAIALENG